MARQSTTPVQFPLREREEKAVVMTSGFAGKTTMVDFIPVLRGDSMSGKFGIDIDLAEMPRPLLNAVNANVQAWFVAKSAFPQFSGYDEFMNSYHGEQIKALGQPDRDPPDFFSKEITTQGGAHYNLVKDSDFYKTLGIHIGQVPLNTDLMDAYNLVYNFRLAAHSSNLPRRSYAKEDLAASTAFGRAFWPSGRLASIVPDYERALVVGALDLDVSAGQVPIKGIAFESVQMLARPEANFDTEGAITGGYDAGNSTERSSPNRVIIEADPVTGYPKVLGELANQQLSVTLADIDKARETQAYAKLRAAMAGNDPSGFVNDDVIIAELMQGFNVPADQYKRPWLLDAKRVTFGMNERHATDAANLDQSISKGRASAVLSVNLPRQDVGGYIIFTVEVLPERIHEAQEDPSIHLNDVSAYPDALRDSQRVEPVDVVEASRIDVRHTTPDLTYGYEPMNNKWNRNFTRLGGSFFQSDPANPWTDQRSAIWMANVVDPLLNQDHYLAPENFPTYVFSDTLAPNFELVCRHDVKVMGLTQIGDALFENSDDYTAISEE